MIKFEIYTKKGKLVDGYYEPIWRAFMIITKAKYNGLLVVWVQDYEELN